jgi:site-specific DNA-adenine methylase
MVSLMMKQLSAKDDEIKELMNIYKTIKIESDRYKNEKEELQTQCSELERKQKELSQQNKLKDDTLSSTVQLLNRQTFNSRSDDFKLKMTEVTIVVSAKIS